MSLQNAKSEEKFMSHNAWLSVFMGITVLIVSIHPFVEGYETIANFTFGIAFLGSFIMFCLQGGLKSKKLYMDYQNEFLSTINTKAFKHSAYGLIGAFILASIFSGNILADVTHASMALIYLGIGSITYGLSLIWQSRG